MEPNFSAYPFSRLRKLSRRDAQIESTIAQWIAARSRGERLAKLVGASTIAVSIQGGGSLAGHPSSVGSAAPSFDPFAARCEVRVAGAALQVRGSSLAIRAIAQHLLGGPAELAAPRPLGVVEKSIFSLVVATALEDLGVPGEVWPILDDDLDAPAPNEARTRVGRPSKAAPKPADEAHVGRPSKSAPPPADGPAIIGLDVTFGDIALAVQIHAAPELLLRVPPSRALPAWFDTTQVDAAIVVGRCALAVDDVARLAVRSVITLERPAGNAELHVLGGAIGLAAPPSAVVAKVATGYLARDMSLPDHAHVELTVALGTTQLSLRQLSELAIGQIVQLGRPLAGPFELRAAGRVVGRGELVDVDGELAVRIVSLGD